MFVHLSFICFHITVLYFGHLKKKYIQSHCFVKAKLQAVKLKVQGFVVRVLHKKDGHKKIELVL